jgi:hypothetical protein
MLQQKIEATKDIRCSGKTEPHSANILAALIATADMQAWRDVYAMRQRRREMDAKPATGQRPRVKTGLARASVYLLGSHEKPCEDGDPR